MLTPLGIEGGSLNSHPVLSPSGGQVVFLSNRSGTPDLYLLDLETEDPPRVLVRGARSGKFESLHPLRSSAGWSPDGKLLVVAAQKGARDALYVLRAEDGIQALEIFDKQADAIRLVVLDRTMPGGSGAEALQDIRRIRRDVPVLLVSGYSQEGSTQRLGDKHVDGFLHRMPRKASGGTARNVRCCGCAAMLSCGILLSRYFYEVGINHGCKNC